MKKLFRLLFAFDSWFLEKCQSFSDKITQITGIGNANYKIAYICLSLFFVSTIGPPLILEQNIFVNLVIAASITMTSLIYLMILKHEERRDKRLSGSMARKGSGRSSFAHARIFVILVVPFKNIFSISVSINSTENIPDKIILNIIQSCAELFFLLFLYFAACSKLPPRRGKLNKKIEGLQASQIPAKAATK